MLRCVAVCCSVLQCVAVCCSVLQRHWDQTRVSQDPLTEKITPRLFGSQSEWVKYEIRVSQDPLTAAASLYGGVLQCVAVCCSVLQCVTVCCSVLQCVAVCCSVLQCVAAALGSD